MKKTLQEGPLGPIDYGRMQLWRHLPVTHAVTAFWVEKAKCGELVVFTQSMLKNTLSGELPEYARLCPDCARQR